MRPIEILKRHYKAHPEAFAILLPHAEAVAARAVEIATKLPHHFLDTEFIHEAALLHDLGIYMTKAPALGCTGEHPYICHGWLGYRMLMQEGMPRHARVCLTHVGLGLTAEDITRNAFPLPVIDMVPVSLEEKIICYADKFYSKIGNGNAELPLERIRKGIDKYGPGKLAAFDVMHGMFG